MTKLGILLLLASLFVLSGCNRNFADIPPHEPLTLQDVLSIAQERREGIEKPEIDSISHLFQERGGTAVNRARFRTTGRIPEMISSQRLIDDFNMFSNALRQRYGLYIYFGGDDVFLPLFEQVNETLALQEYWYIDDFSNLVFDTLSYVIDDLHFIFGGRFVGGEIVGGRILGDMHDFFVPTNFSDVFDKSENGSRNRRTGLYVQELHFDGKPLCSETEEVFRLMMCNNGMFYYSIVVVRPSGGAETVNVTILYENGRYDEVYFSPFITTMREFVNVSLQYIQGFPVITIMGMFFPNRDVDSPYFTMHNYYANKFLDLAEEVRDEPVIIVDIRSNGGGNGNLSEMWLHSVVGEVVPTNFLSVVNIGDYLQLDLECLYSAMKLVCESYALMYTMPHGIIPNEQLIILLTDRYTGSAGDTFASSLFSLENALVIGQNTTGVIIGNVGGEFGGTIGGKPLLPNSGVAFAFGNSANIFPPGFMLEGIGIAPDIWVNGDALEATLAMLGASSF